MGIELCAPVPLKVNYISVGNIVYSMVHKKEDEIKKYC